MSKHNEEKKSAHALEISDGDVYEAMKHIPGYLDITPGDFKELYRYAYQQALQRISGSRKASEIMTGEVVTVETSTPLKLVARVMAEKGVSGVPVIDNNRCVAGVISEKDFLVRMGGKEAISFMSVVATCLKGKGCVALSVREKRAEDIMTSPAITVAGDTSLTEVAKLISERKINRIPVVDKAGKLIGIITREDIVAATQIKG